MMRLIFVACLTALIFVSFSSCETEKKEERDCIAYVKKNTMEPFTDFRVENNRVHLIGNRNHLIPVGDVNVTLWGSSRFGLFAISYWRRIQQQEFKPEFDLSEVEMIELPTAGTSYTRGNDSLKVIYEQILQDFNKEKYGSCSICYDLPAWCFTKLQHPETGIGFRRHFSQNIGDRPMLLRYPFIRINEVLIFTDMKKKGILKAEDTVYTNCGGRGYNYRKVFDLDIKILKKS